uniref:phospholipase B1, membrane-associated-like n=1 Tax=Ciona intestinalis TaxID=7719 RepID=UPI000EF4897B|nr:phospholipase B1, membrane-associated-like [Ciona intestinalis]|eukprot:XP_026690473.1 phospholipase B1, membrane-associated-like [Ciona intestinalis]
MFYVIIPTKCFIFEDDELNWIKKMEKLDSIMEDKKSAGDAKMTTGTNDFGIQLQCEPKPTSVHELRPQDVDVVGAMGDSITVSYFEDDV